MTTEQQVTAPLGHIAMTTHGSVTMESCVSWGEMRAHCAGIKGLRWSMVPGSLVNKARNEAALQMLQDGNAHWLLFIDADMQWHPTALHQLVSVAYGSMPWADIVGAWCPLRGFPYLPTIDPGSGTWEPVAPNSGPVEVMRTGAAFVLVKRHVFERMRPPWYSEGFREPVLEAMTTLDAYASTKFDGRNPLRESAAWNVLERCAAQESQPKGGYPLQVVGEDSNFCDRARALGFRIVVNTDTVVHHVDRKVITAKDHLDAMKQLREGEAHAAGLLEDV